MNEDGVKRLCNAMMLDVVEEYKSIMCSSNPRAIERKKQLEKYFCSQRFELFNLTNMTGEEILSVLKHRARHGKIA